MNRIAGRAWITMLFAFVLLGGFVFFLCEYTANAGDWVVFSGSPHLYNSGTIDCGVVTDSDGFILLDMRDGRSYSNVSEIRSSTVHWVGDRYGNIDAPVLPYYSEEISGFDMINGVYNYGNNSGTTRLTLSADVQIAAMQALGDYKGTVSVYNYKTGDLICAVSAPNYDPDNVPDLDADSAGAYEGVYINRFTQSVYTPGSIFKIVTLAAALETIPNVRELTFSCSGEYSIGADNITCETAHGQQSLKTAFCNSCNCAFAEIALQLGGETLSRYVNQFGLTESITFDGITSASGKYDVMDAADVNVAWSAVGQYNDLTNPAVFLNFVGSIANGGRGLTPHLVDEISVGGAVTYKAKTDLNERIMSTLTAATIQEYMAYNVTEKYGEENFYGMNVCAKTGTAEVGGEKKPNAMFAGFVSDEKYPFAFVICVENAGYGKTVCVPIAAKVLAACKSHYDKP